MSKFGSTSLKHMKGLHPDLLKVLNAAILDTPIDFRITDGKRTIEEQRKFVKEGKSKTLKSRHLSGKAVDIVGLPGGRVSWRIPVYQTVAKHILAKAKKLNISLTWGGSWKSFPDYVHFELDKTKYGY